MQAPRLCLLDIGPLDDAQLAPFAEWLGPDEQARLQRFVRPQRRRQFIAGRALARMMLADLLGQPAATLVIDERPGHKPLCKGAHFSISHSGNWVACMASRKVALGLDIELPDPARDVLAVAAQVFSDGEVAALGALGDAARRHEFHRLWTLHEARIKLGQPEVQSYAGWHGELALAWCSAAPLDAVPVQVLAGLN